MGLHSTYALILLFLLVFIFMISCTNITKKKKIYIFIVVLLLGILGSLFNPIKAFRLGDYTDLYRFYQTLDSIKGLPFNNNVPIFQEYNNFPVMKVLLFIISRTGINSLLPFVSCFVFYGLFGLLLIKITEKYNVSSKTMGLAFFIFICLFNFKMVISNIRCSMGCSIFLLTLYYEIIERPKRKTYLLGYLICCCIHPIFILFFVIKILLQLTNKYTDKIVFILILLYSFFINVFLDFISRFTDSEVFSYLSMKIDYYANIWEANINEPLLILTGILQIILLIYLLFIVRKIIKKNSNEEIFYRITMSFVILSISSFWNFVIFQRTTWLLVLFIVYWYVYIKGARIELGKQGISLCDIVMVLFVLFSLASYFLTYQYNVLTF